jgi:hypothetical protein
VKQLIILIFVFTVPLFSQWEVAGSFNRKIDHVETGLGIQVVRRLPFQFPKLGLSTRLSVEIFYPNYRDSDLSSFHFTSDYNFSLLANYITRYMQPYTGFGFGLSHFLAEARLPNRVFKFSVTSEKHIFTLNALTGIRFTFLENYYPFAEIQYIKYMADFGRGGEDLSSGQFRYSAGLYIRFNVIDTRR